MASATKAALWAVPAVLALSATASSSAAQEFEWTTYLNPNRPVDLVVSDGKVWLVSQTGGVTVYDIEEASFSTIHRRQGGLSSNRLARTVVDAEGRLWFGTLASGAAFLDPRTPKWSYVTSFEGVPSDTIVAMGVWEDSVWLGTPTGFAVYRGESLAGRCNVRLPPDVRCPLASHDIRALAPLSEGAYLGTAAGVLWYDGASSEALDEGWTLGPVIDLVVGDEVPWVLTTQGAFRWNPNASEWIQTNGLPASGLNRLHVSQGVLYAATSLGVYSWSGTRWTRMGDSFRALAFAGSAAEGYWAAGVEGLYRYETDQWVRLPAAGPPFDGISSIAVGGAGELWSAGSDQRTALFDGHGWELLDPLTTDGALQSCDVNGLLVDSSNRVWFGHCCKPAAPGECAVDMLERGQGARQWSRFDAPNIWSIEEGGGSMWFASRLTGLYRLRDGEADTERIGSASGMASESLWSLAFEAGRGLWIGHRQNGVDLFTGALTGDPSGWVHLSQEDDFLLSDNVRDVLVVGDRLWVGTLSGVSIVDPSTMTVVRNYTVGPGGLQDRITAVEGLAVDAAGDVWVATDGGGVYLIPQSGGVLSFKTRNSPITSDGAADVAYDPFSGAVWIGTRNGLNRAVRTGPQGRAPDVDVFVYPTPYCPAGCGDFEGGPLRLGGIEGAVDGDIVDVKGQIVARFFDAGAGDPIWDGIGLSGRPAGSGLYFVVARSASGTYRAKFALVR